MENAVDAEVMAAGATLWGLRDPAQVQEPAVQAPPAAGAPGGGAAGHHAAGRKQSKAKRQSFKIYIQKVLKQVTQPPAVWHRGH